MAAPLKRGDIVSLRIEDLAFGGPGVARVDGYVVMVHKALPGDTVRAEVRKVRRSYAEATAVEVLEPSGERIDPVCVHFGVCGGCRWQDLNYEAQLRYKKQQVVDALERIGRFEEAPVEDPIPSKDRFFYRNKMEFSFGTGPDGELTLGLHPGGSYMDVFDLEKCHLESDTSNRIVEVIRDQCRARNLQPYNVKSHEGFLRYLTVREGKLTGEVMVNLVTAEGHKEEVAEIAQHTVSEVPAITSFLRSINSRRATVAVGEKEEVLYGRSYITERLADATFEITASSFFQTNSRQAEKLYSTVLEAADLQPEDRLLDLYSGTGTISILAAASVAEVRGVESHPDSVRNAERNAALNGHRNCFFIRADAKKALSAMTTDRQPPSVVTVNPPRAGLSKGVVHHMLQLKPRRIVYVSCNPATFARDLGLICERDHTLRWVRPVDMFPHTSHIECVALVERTPGTRMAVRAEEPDGRGRARGEKRRGKPGHEEAPETGRGPDREVEEP